MIKQIKRRLAIATLVGLITSFSSGVTYAASSNEQTFVISTDASPTGEPIEDINETYVDGWTTTAVNVRMEPDINASILTVYELNTQIQYTEYDDNWVKIKYNDSIGYIAKQYISNTKCEYIEIRVPDHRDFKSYMGYKSITKKSSPQYKLQANYAYTGDYGIRMVNGRYCIAVGSYFKTAIGQYLDVVLENGVVIPCIMGDAKADKDTDRSHIFTSNGCCSEFIVDRSVLAPAIKNSGSASSACAEWNSKVIAIRVYNKNVFNEY